MAPWYEPLSLGHDKEVPHAYGCEGFSPDQLNQLGGEGWEAVSMSLKRGDLVAWPVVLLKRAID